MQKRTARQPPEGEVLYYHRQQNNKKYSHACITPGKEVTMNNKNENIYNAKNICYYIGTVNCNEKTVRAIIADYFKNCRQQIKETKHSDIYEDARYMIRYCMDGKLGKVRMCSHYPHMKELNRAVNKLRRRRTIHNSPAMQKAAEEVCAVIYDTVSEKEVKALLLSILNNWSILKNRVVIYDVLVAAVLLQEPEGKELYRK